MAKRDKGLEQVLSGKADANIDFGDLRQLLKRLGFAERHKYRLTPTWRKLGSKL